MTREHATFFDAFSTSSLCGGLNVRSAGKLFLRSGRRLSLCGGLNVLDAICMGG